LRNFVPPRTVLILRPLDGFGTDQYEVVHGGRHLGRIYLANANSRTGYNWFWGINWFERPKDTAHLPGWDGFAPSREAAMGAFRKAWDAMERDG
jgi:hypothetical protein